MADENRRGFYQTSRANFRHMIFQTILHRGTVNRQQLAKLLQIRYVTLQKLLEELLAEKILQESGNVIIRRGRAPISLSINPNGGRVVGVALEPTQVSAVLLGLDANVIETKQFRVDSMASLESIRNAIRDSVRFLIEGPNGAGHKLWGIGYSEYGLIDIRRGVTIRSTHHANWVNVPIRQILQETFDTNVRVDMAERCALRSELLWGKAHDARCVLLLDVEEGVGLAVYSDGHILQGANGFAGEVGHIKVIAGGELCNCGARGCLETVSGIEAIVNQVRQGVRRGTHTDLGTKVPAALTIEDVMEAASNGDDFSTHVLDRALRHLGSVTGMLINIFNPDLICFRGRLLHKAGDRLLRTIRHNAELQTLREIRQGIRWEQSEIQNASALGAAACVFETLLEPTQVPADTYFALPPSAVEAP